MSQKRSGSDAPDFEEQPRVDEDPWAMPTWVQSIFNDINYAEIEARIATIRSGFERGILGRQYVNSDNSPIRGVRATYVVIDDLGPVQREDESREDFMRRRAWWKEMNFGRPGGL